MPGRRSSTHRGGWALCAAVAVALVASACGGSGFHYVKSSEDRTFFKVPDSWKLYDNDDLLDAEPELTEEQVDQRRETQWATVFDAHPTPALGHIANQAPRYPVGRAIVQDLNFESADAVSLAALRNLFYDIDGMLEKETAQLVSYEPVERDGGFRGSHLVAELQTKNGTIVVDQIALLDQATTKVYALTVQCSVECYEKNQSQIETVVDSWTVEES